MRFIYSYNVFYTYINLALFVFCSVFLFTNCSSDKAVPPLLPPPYCLESITLQSTDPNNVVTVDNNVSDFSWSKVSWLNSHNVSNSDWDETSHITSVDVRQDGKICIDHTKKNDWPGAFPFGAGTNEVVGNPYLIVKVNGIYYIGSYEWLKSNQECKLGIDGPLSTVYSGEDSIGAKIGGFPFSNLTLEGGEVVGFMVSGLARDHVTPNVKERSNIIWYKLPPADGTSKGEAVGAYGDDGNCCPPPEELDIVEKVARETNSLFETDPAEFTKKVAQCLKDIDERWGLRRDDSNVILRDMVAYRVGGEDKNPYNVDIVQIAGNTHVQWLKTGRVGGTLVSVSGDCVLDNVEEGECDDLPNHCKAGDFHNHPPDTDAEYLWTCRNRPHVLRNGKRKVSCKASKSECSQESLDKGFKVVDGECLPSCAFFASKVDRDGVKAAKNNECRDIQNYNIAYVNRKTHDAEVCCLRSSKNTCPNHYYKIGNNCFPSCGSAAHSAGWGGYGVDEKPNTSDDSHVFSKVACEDAEVLGQTDWKNMPNFYDRYNLRDLNKREIKEVSENSGSACCVRGSQVRTPTRMPDFLINKHPDCE